MKRIARRLALLCLTTTLAPGLAATTIHTAAGAVRSTDEGWILDGDAGPRPLDLPVFEQLVPVTAGTPALLAGAVEETGRTVLVELDARGATLHALDDLDPGHGVEGLCGAGDGEALTVFVGDGDGRWSHWLLRRGGDGWRSRIVRTLHTGPDSERCALDPLSERLWITEAGIGVWEYGAGVEAPAERRLLGHDPAFEPEALVAVAGGVRWLDADGTTGPTPLPGTVTALEAAVPPRAAMAVTNDARLALEGDPDAGPPRAVHPTVPPRLQTGTVDRAGDAADDPALWVHPRRPGRSLILGTDKQSGLLVFDLDGRRLQHLAAGRLNNVDVRQDARGDGIAVATNRTDRSLSVFRIAAGRTPVRELGGETPLDGLGDPYGVCLHEGADGGLRVFVNDTDGRVERHRLHLDGDRARLVREARLQLASQPEGCVVDDDRGILWLGEEARGVWRFPVDFTHAGDGTLAVATADSALVPDVEGLARARLPDGRELLLVSSQGDDSYALFDVTDVTDAAPRWLGSVRIGPDVERGLDGASETDGLELVADDLGGRFPGGVVIVQDGRNRMPEAPQNFKVLALDDLLGALEAR
jgi:3-phytase